MKLNEKHKLFHIINKTEINLKSNIIFLLRKNNIFELEEKIVIRALNYYYFGEIQNS